MKSTVNVTSESYLTTIGMGNMLHEWGTPKVDFERKQCLGFCDNEKCARTTQVYRVAARRWYFVTKNKDIVDCPGCDHALYWSCYWHIVEEENEVLVRKKDGSGKAKGL